MLIQNQKQLKTMGVIGKGSFGTIYQAIAKLQNQKMYQNNKKNIQNNKLVAIKCEDICNPHPMLHTQYKILNEMFNLYKSKQIYPYPIIYQFGQQETFQYLVLEKLQMTLDQKKKTLLGNLLNTISLLNIIYQVLTAIEGIHNFGYMHRDIKPGNLMLRRQQKGDVVVLIDYGLCKSYLKGNQHISYKQGKKLTGTPMFSSRNADLGRQQSRRDDLQSWFYTSISLINKLPWEKYSTEIDREKQRQLIKSNKLNFQIEEIKEFPQCMVTIWNYINKLHFQETPNYQYLYNKIEENCKKIGGKITPYIEWDKKIPTGEKQINNLKIKFTVKKSNTKQKINIEELNKNTNIFESIMSKKYSDKQSQKLD